MTAEPSSATISFRFNCHWGGYRVIKYLLQHEKDSIDINYAGDAEHDTEGDRKTPLHGAAVHGAPGIVHLLLNNGANPFLKTLSGKTPLELAQKEMQCLLSLPKKERDMEDEHKILGYSIICELLTAHMIF